MADTKTPTSQAGAGLAAGIGVADAAGQIAGGFINASIMREQGKILLQRAEFNYAMSNLERNRVQDELDNEIEDFMTESGTALQRGVATAKTRQAAGNVNVKTGAPARVRDDAVNRGRAKARRHVEKVRAETNAKLRSQQFSSEQGLLAGMTAKASLDLKARYAGVQGVLQGAQTLGAAAVDSYEAGLLGKDKKQKKEYKPSKLVQKLADRNGTTWDKVIDTNITHVTAPPDLSVPRGLDRDGLLQGRTIPTVEMNA